MDNQPNGADLAAPPQLTEGQQAYMIACGALDNLSTALVKACRAYTTHPHLEAMIGSLQGKIMIRELEFAALLSLLKEAKLVEGPAYMERFCQIAIGACGELKAQIDAIPKIAVASTIAPAGRPR